MSKIPTPAGQVIDLNDYFIQETGHEKHIASAGVKRTPALLWIALNSSDQELRGLGQRWLGHGTAMCSSSQRLVHRLIGGAVGAMNTSINISAERGGGLFGSAMGNSSNQPKPEQSNFKGVQGRLSSKFSPEPKPGGEQK